MKHRLLVLLLTLILLLTACEASSSDSVTDITPGENNSSGMDVPSTGDTGIPDDSLDGSFDRKIIRTVDMSCESMAYDNAITTIMTALAAHNGYVETSSFSGGQLTRSTAEGGTSRRAEYTLRIPAEKLDAFLESLRTDGNIHITSQSMNSSEITGSYYDTQTRIETLTAEKNALSAMLEGFTDYSDISAMLEVQQRLYDVIEEMEALQTQLNLYDSQVAYSTVHLSLREVIEYTETEKLSFGDRIGNAFVDSWTGFGRGCQNFAVVFVRIFPTLLVLGAIAVGVILIIKWSIKRSNAKKKP